MNCFKMVGGNTYNYCNYIGCASLHLSQGTNMSLAVTGTARLLNMQIKFMEKITNFCIEAKLWYCDKLYVCSGLSAYVSSVLGLVKTT